MLGLVNKYRWELWLFLGIPVVAPFVGAGLFVWPFLDMVDDAYRLQSIGAAAMAAILLGVSYVRIRRLERPMLAVFWRYSFAVAVVAAVSFAMLDQLPSRSLTVLAARSAALAVLFPAVQLWFAREASRISLPHAFFLIALTIGGGASLFSLWWGFDVDRIGAYGAAALVGSAVLGVMVAVFGIWGLANFDGLGRESRRRTVLALLALGTISAAVAVVEAHRGDFPGLPVRVGSALLSILIVLGLTYVVRVRRPLATS